MAQTTGQNLPPPQSPFVDPSTGILANDGYQYLLSLLNAADSNQATATVASGLEATGTNQATALQLSSQWNEIVSAANAGAGALLSAYDIGQQQVVFNGLAGALLVYPPPGMQIDALAINQAYSLGAGTRLTFEFWSAMQIRS